MSNLVLSLFRGIGILDRGFEEEGYCVVSGPDLLWGSDVRDFHAPAGVFEGVIGGPPCQCFSRLRYVNPLCGNKTGNLIPEFERVVAESQPDWFVMENLKESPIPNVHGYQVDPSLFNNRFLGEKENRVHRFSFGTRDGRQLRYDIALFENPLWEPRVCASDYRRTPVKLLAGKKLRKGALNLRPKRSLEEASELQGLPTDFFKDSPFRRDAQMRMLGNAVPLPMARALARAVRRAMGNQPLVRNSVRGETLKEVGEWLATKMGDFISFDSDYNLPIPVGLRKEDIATLKRGEIPAEGKGK